jgi:hypothetical protein
MSCDPARSRPPSKLRALPTNDFHRLLRTWAAISWRSQRADHRLLQFGHYGTLHASHHEHAAFGAVGAQKWHFHLLPIAPARSSKGTQRRP